jgi:eukaryotic-like serine/threonine-protein kinase
VLHRDIKPENLLLDGRHVVVTDFGVGKALNEAGGSSLTATGFVVGTPAYMSPEQAAGDPDLDGRSDLYSLGIVMYEMIAGVLPFTGKNVQQLMASRFLSRPRALRQLREDVPEGLADIVHRLLQEHPAERFADAAETAAALRNLEPLE